MFSFYELPVYAIARVASSWILQENIMVAFRTRFLFYALQVFTTKLVSTFGEGCVLIILGAGSKQIV